MIFSQTEKSYGEKARKSKNNVREKIKKEKKKGSRRKRKNHFHQSKNR